MFDALAGLLAQLYKIWPSYGGSIALFTLVIMLVLTPLSIKSTRSMIAMQRVQPELKRLQAKHKGDREALNKEMMGFYKEHDINPFSSCLPLLLQMPVFIVLYQVLNGLTRRGTDGFFNPKYLEGEDTPLAVALRSHTEMRSFGMDLSQSALDTLKGDGVLTALPFLLLVGLVAVTAYVQQRQIAGRNLSSASASSQQQLIGKVMPFVFIPISLSIPAGVVIYFVVSNLVRIGQQGAVTRIEFGNFRGPSGDAPLGPAPKASGSPTKGLARSTGETSANGGVGAEPGVEASPRPKRTTPKPSGANSSGSNGNGQKAGGRGAGSTGGTSANGGRARPTTSNGSASSRPPARSRKKKRK